MTIMDFDEIAEAQGWSEITIIHILRSFISRQGLQDALDQYAKEQADEENDYAKED
jgi:hypothetical protein